jgi:hypothetical protein
MVEQTSVLEQKSARAFECLFRMFLYVHLRTFEQTDFDFLEEVQIDKSVSFRCRFKAQWSRSNIDTR